MSKIVFHTQVYNGETTLRRAIESVLNQTYTYLTYYIEENGSTDGTRAIVREYAERDERIVPIYYDENDLFAFSNKGLAYILAHETKDVWFAHIDDDDEYSVEFAEKAIALAESENLDFVAGGILQVDKISGKIISKRVLRDTLIVEGKGFSDEFIKYYKCANTFWGKIFKLSIIEKVPLAETMAFRTIGGDTSFTLNYLARCERVGFINEPLHRYSISQDSEWHTLLDGRAADDARLFEFCKEYLFRKCGFVSKKNENFLYGGYYLNSLRTLKVAFKSKIPLSKKLEVFREILASKQINIITFFKGVRGALLFLKTQS
jgi:glycosyltransferase involved in cell wall biosynthesis